QRRLPFKEYLRLQFKQDKHSLIVSFALVLSVLRRLIISSVSICISPRHSWLFHFAYLVSFLPSMKTFIVDVLPSKLYKDKFGIVVTQTIRRYRGIL
ncbi:unnamed protein product, partial [Rotaria sp. Silwood1]